MYIYYHLNYFADQCVLYVCTSTCNVAKKLQVIAIDSIKTYQNFHLKSYQKSG